MSGLEGFLLSIPPSKTTGASSAVLGVGDYLDGDESHTAFKIPREKSFGLKEDLSRTLEWLLKNLRTR